VDGLRIANGTDQKNTKISLENKCRDGDMSILVSNIIITLKYVEYVDVILIPVSQVIQRYFFANGKEYIDAIKGANLRLCKCFDF
jgi:hypothetical protein